MRVFRSRRIPGKPLPADRPPAPAQDGARRARPLAPTRRARLALLASAVLFAAGDGALASSGGPYTIDPAVVASGGATSSGGSFRLSGTIGQASIATLTASGFRLHSGFWSNEAPASDRIFADGFDP
jgi:hypothetical protein